jgi:hypothetical protein
MLTGYQTKELGDKTDTHLTPAKLAAFYKTAGHDWDCKLPVVSSLLPHGADHKL